MEFQLSISAPGGSHRFEVWVEPEGMYYELPETGPLVLSFRGPDAMRAEFTHRPDKMIVWRPAGTEVWASVADGEAQQIAGWRQSRPGPGPQRQPTQRARTRTDRPAVPSNRSATIAHRPSMVANAASVPPPARTKAESGNLSMWAVVAETSGELASAVHSGGSFLMPFFRELGANDVEAFVALSNDDCNASVAACCRSA
ncbi:hypothetical protein AB0M46_14755 [Dactylosporangium sp. NPDC051485]|uniref:hypothetical protein n=1 Tax=Dactylosporangium sp. NPDC051485 TaxID=3154846 RepID=UPI0034315E1D